MNESGKLERIPEVPGFPFIGNALEMNLDFPLSSFLGFADKHGEIFRLRFPGRDVVLVTTQALVHELSDESRFEKSVGAALLEVRNGTNDGIFTAFPGEASWAPAHRILMPAFGPVPIQGMFSEMHEIAGQLALKWARHGPDTPIIATEDFTRLTLDTLALCSMNFRFNSYYHDELHPFVAAMGDFLKMCGTRSTVPYILQLLGRKSRLKYWDDIRILRETAEEVLRARKANPTDRRDLLSAMLDGVDRVTGTKLSDASIVDNLITFLIAGHETTSGLLGFAFYQMLKKPEVYCKAQQEVDDIVGTRPLKVEHMKQLPYISAILRETLRMCPTIPVYTVQPKNDDILAGKYPVKKGQKIMLVLARSQVDPAVFGETANDFIPERMLDENFERLSKEFPDFWKPFGNGTRGCIGRGFAWQEATLVMAMLLQNFNFSLHDPSYQLQIKQTLTTKPKDFYIRAALRHGMTPTDLTNSLGGHQLPIGASKAGSSMTVTTSKPETHSEMKPMSIYYGSNTSTCETLAQRLAADASAHGFQATVVDPLDAAKRNLPKDRPVIMITASYEGQPPDNAAMFFNWMENLKENELDGVSFAVFGCGHQDWARTFHRVPKLIDEKAYAHGGTRICKLGLTDASQGEILTDFEQWEDDVFWPAMGDIYGISPESADGESHLAPSLDVQFSAPRASTLGQDVKEAVVVRAHTTTKAGAAVPKKHLEIQLPGDQTYKAGDYLAVLPVNPKETVARALRRFQLGWGSSITIKSDGRTTLPVNIPIQVNEVLGSYVELAQPATKRSILALIAASCDSDSATRDHLQSLLSSPETFTASVTLKRLSLLDLLESNPSISLPFGSFLALLPPMRVRMYSISSSPLWNPHNVTLTYSILDGSPSLTNPHASQRRIGVATSYLSSLEPGDRLTVSVRQGHAAFHLPLDVEKIPIIMIAAGAGVAPFRGFVQERAAQVGGGRKLAPAILFFGCRGPAVDDLYREEFDKWEKIGAVQVRRAFSRQGGVEEGRGCKRVGDRLWYDRDDVYELWQHGAKVFVCGSREVCDGVKRVLIRMAIEEKGRLCGMNTTSTEGGGEPTSEEKALAWLESIRNSRYAVDAFD
ncbi:putative bifunctional P-450:NADPH-P450 reductase [Apodospora peruviana]|uniref:Bifunctional cytochrome P450/NADPH--P450 reductase n=1 Tax=Apodospora peruviana TaxID=516989 RepID=A0AAE0I6Z3_9PEZI|nr:putative bifunctional P-450:NADPH-P450 reductase [Apodospora peruviana]